MTSAVAKILAGSDEIIRQETGFTNFPPKNLQIKKLEVMEMESYETCRKKHFKFFSIPRVEKRHVKSSGQKS